MKRHAVFYFLTGPYGPLTDGPLEVFLCEAEDSAHALEQFADAEPGRQFQFVMVQC